MFTVSVSNPPWLRLFLSHVNTESYLAHLPLSASHNYLYVNL